MSKLLRVATLSIFMAAPMSMAALSCDGTLTGIGRVPREPETKLPPAPVETVNKPDPTAAGVPSNQPTEIGAQHLLVMYKGSKSAPAGLARSRDEARARAAEALARVKSGEAFEKVVAAYTDEPGGAKRGGDLGRFAREQMVKPFADAAFALQPGQVSGVVESPFGFHVIRRTE